jgi:beta-1,4-N-acetylglucosaminyltransferase
MPKRVFVTVGSTEFPQLIKALLTPKTLGTLTALGYTDICVQYGTNKQLFEHGIEACHISGLSIRGFDYSPSIDDEMKQADLIISHAGNLSRGRF